MDAKRNSALVLRAVALALCCLSFCGCQTFGWLKEASLPDEPVAESVKPAEGNSPAKVAADKPVNAKSPSGADRATTSDAPSPAKLLEALASDGWVQAVAPSASFSAEPTWQNHWRHAGLAAIEANPRIDLSTAIADERSIISANAAILAARQNTQNIPPAVVADALTVAVNNQDMRLPLRTAAAEALGTLNGDDAPRQLRQLLQRYGKFPAPGAKDNAAAPYVSELHAELLIALARQSASPDEQEFAQAVKSPAPIVRSAVVDAWTLAAPEIGPAVLPTPVANLRDDPETRVRAGALRAIARRPSPDAIASLQRGVEDYELTVRLAAIQGLGLVGGESAKEALMHLQGNPAEAARAAAVSALFAMGARQDARDWASDKAWRVREAVAVTLTSGGVDEADWAAAAAVARELTHDINLRVALATLDALDQWPLDRSGELLLDVLQRGGYQARKRAALQLTRQWPAAEQFPVDGAPERRETELAKLRTQWFESTAVASRTHSAARQAGNLEVASATGNESSTATAAAMLQSVDLLLTQLDQQPVDSSERLQTLGALKQLGVGGAAALDSWSLAHDATLPEDVYRDVLPAHSPVYKDLEQLRTGSGSQRYTAAERLVIVASATTLPNLALERLVALVQAEHDPLVWQAALRACAADPRPAAERLAYLAAGNPADEVRRRACQYLAAHPNRRHAQVLLPMLQDQNGSVRTAAVRALGHAGPLDNPQPLIDLLATRDKLLRLETAVSLARLHVEQGSAALERLALDNELEIRRGVAVALGDLAEPDDLPLLINLLDDRAEVQQAALHALVKSTGQQMAPPGQSLPATEEARLWKEWYRGQTSKPSSAAATSNP